MARLGARGLAHNHEPDTVVYTGTHDNDTKAGGWATATDHERCMARGYLPTDGLDMPWTLIRAAATDCRMNFPGKFRRSATLSKRLHFNEPNSV